MSKRSRVLSGAQKPFGKLFDSVCGRHNPWEVWSAFVTMSAISISNAVDQDHAESREQEYLRIAKKFNKDEIDCLCAMLGELTMQLEQNPYQDFLGDLYLALGMNDHWKGQFFTPYHMCEFMTAISSNKAIQAEVDEKGWISVQDPACGAGAMLVAYAGECRKQNVNYQTSVLFVGQDIDPIVAYMCYLQLSLLGCAGYVVIGDSLANPARSIDGRALIPDPRQDVWYTPFYFREEWHLRRQAFFLTNLVREAFRKDNAPNVQPDGEEPISAAKDAAPMVEEPALTSIELGETNTGQLMFL